MKHIVILGGGFGGLSCAINLVKQFKPSEVRITLVDKEAYHSFHADLYEVATAPDEVTSVSQLQKSLMLSLSEVLGRHGIAFVKGTVTSIDPEKREIRVGGRVLAYDYTVCAFGSVTSYYNIPGAPEHTLPLKSFTDALRIRNAVEFLIQRHRQDTSKYVLRIGVVGGGFTGVELAAELSGLLNFLSWKYSYPRDKIEVLILEAGNRLLGGLPEQVVHVANRRLTDLGVHIQLNAHIVKVAERLVYLASGAVEECDLLLWTAGVEAVTLPFTTKLPTDRCHRIVVNEFLQTPQYHNIFFIGDNMCQDSSPDPTTASFAIHQARYVATALPFVVQNRRPRPYASKHLPFIIALGGRFAILASDKVYIKGRLAYLAKLYANFRYFKSLIGTTRALRWVFGKSRVYAKND